MKRVIKAFYILLSVIFVMPGALASDKTNKPVIKTVDNYIAVFDFEVTTGDKGISRPLTESVRREIVLSGQYDVIDRGNMNKILGEQKFQLSGCVAQECIVDAGQLLGVGKIISGTVSIVGKTYYLTLSLISVKTGKIENIAEDTCRCEVDELLGSTKRLAKKLLGEQVEQPTAAAESAARAKAEETERAKAEQIAKARAEAEAAARTEAAVRAKAEEAERAKAAQTAKARAEAEAAARVEAEAMAKAEEAERIKAAQIAKARAEAEAAARVEAEARAKAEEAERIKAAQIAKARAEAEAAARTEAVARAKAEEAERIKAAQIAKARAEAEAAAKAEEIERAKADAVAKAEAKKHEIKVTTAAIDSSAVSAKIVSSDGRFEKLISGVVRDTQSGLDWYAGPDKNTGWDDAKQWVAGLMVDGGGWRMPAMEELKGLYQKGAGSRNMTSLLETTGWLVWSGKTAAIASFDIRASALDFDDGTELADRQGNSNFKRGFAVRATPKLTTAAIDSSAVSAKIVSSDGRFEKLISGVVRDTQSGLDWYAGPDKDNSKNDANQWAAGLSIDGGGWRMPTRAELKGIYQKGAGSRNMTPLLETTGWLLWSGETGIGPGGGDVNAWAVDFGDGREVLERRNNSSYMRGFAVRSRR